MNEFLNVLKPVFFRILLPALVTIFSYAVGAKLVTSSEAQEFATVAATFIAAVIVGLIREAVQSARIEKALDLPANTTPQTLDNKLSQSDGLLRILTKLF